MMASSGTDGTVRLFDVATEEQIGSSLRGASDTDTRAMFTPDGDRLVAVSEDGTGVVWDVTAERWRRHACAVAGRELTAEEWERFLPDRPYSPTCSAEAAP